MNMTYFIFFLFILFGTLTITYWAAKRSNTTEQFYTVSGSLTGTQNGLAIAGDFISAASFLGITGTIALRGFDGFYYSIGFLVSYIVLLLVIAEPVRRLGTFTLGDVIHARFPYKRIRLFTSCSTIIICVLYMIPQLVAAGVLLHLLLAVEYETSIFVIGSLMTVYVVSGGMIAASWVQIIKTILLMSGTFLITLIVLSRVDWNLLRLIDEVAAAAPYREAFFTAENLLDNPFETLSLNITLLLGTAGLPHILIRFFTVSDAPAVRKSVVTATWVIGVFYLMTLILGFGVVVFVGGETIATTDPTGNLAAPMLAATLGGHFLMAFISAVAFATILAVVTGLVIAGTSSFAHDIYNHVIRNGKAGEKAQLTVARLTAAGIGLLSIVLSLGLKHTNVTFLVSLTFVVAASTHLPLLLFTLYWRRFTLTGAISGMVTGLGSSLLLVLLGPHVMDPQHGVLRMEPLVPLGNPGLIAIPLGFIGAAAGTFLSRTPADPKHFIQLSILSQTGIKTQSGWNKWNL